MQQKKIQQEALSLLDDLVDRALQRHWDRKHIRPAEVLEWIAEDDDAVSEVVEFMAQFMDPTVAIDAVFGLDDARRRIGYLLDRRTGI